jgi:plasmid maintenance system antidote protein VapI
MSKYNTIKKETIEKCLDSIGANVTWLAAQMGVHYNTAKNKINAENKWTQGETELLVKVLGDTIIDGVRLATGQEKPA